MTSSPANRTAWREEENRPAQPAGHRQRGEGPGPVQPRGQDLGAGQVPGLGQQLVPHRVQPGLQRLEHFQRGGDLQLPGRRQAGGRDVPQRGQARPGAQRALAQGRGALVEQHRVDPLHPADLRHLDGQLRDTRKKLAAAVRASGTSLTQVFGVGPVIAGTIAGDVGDVARFPGRDHFASYNGTAPVEVSSGNRKTRRLSLRGNRRINHAIHMAAITRLRHKHSEGGLMWATCRGEDAAARTLLMPPDPFEFRRR